MTEYSEGIYGDGAAILKNGVPMKVHEIVAELNFYRQALVDIENPISKWRRELKEGEQLNGAMAVCMGKDPETYRRMAREALTR